MNQDEYRNLIEWHRGTQRMLLRVQVLLALVFLVVVVFPVLRALGFYNLMGWPDPFL